MKMFLDTEKPLSTCKEEDCKGCDVQGQVFCHFTPKKLLIFLSLGMPFMILGGICTFLYSAWVFAAWVLVVLSYFCVFEIRALCSHCPHYAEPGLHSLKCWANYGSPKLWKYHPGPLKAWEKVVFVGGGCIIFILPMAAAVLSGVYVLLAISVVLVIAWVFIMGRFYCLRCMNFACPFNRVPKDVRDCFFNHNPTVAGAWKMME